MNEKEILEKGLDPLIAFNTRMVEILAAHGEEIFNGWLSAFNKMVDTNRWYILFYTHDERTGACITEDNSINLTKADIADGLRAMLAALEAENDLGEQIDDILQ